MRYNKRKCEGSYHSKTSIFTDDLLSFVKYAYSRAPRNIPLSGIYIKRNRRRGIVMKEIIFFERKEKRVRLRERVAKSRLEDERKPKRRTQR